MKQTANSEPLSLFLRAGTTAIHEQLDKHVSQLNPFADMANYRNFLRMQLRLHTAGEPLYRDSQLNALLPGLQQCSRFDAVLQDCADVNVPADSQQQDQQIGRAVTVSGPYAGLGWLYTIEGSSLGAAMLLKHAKSALDLSESFGARHMAAHEDGCALHWREFRAMLDALSLDEQQREQALDAAKQAFQFVMDAVDQLASANQKEAVDEC